MEIGDTFETTESVEKTEPAENAENTEKLWNTIIVFEISIFTLTVENLQLSCEQCNRTNSSKKGLTQHMWIKQYPSEDFRHDHFDFCSRVYKKISEGQEKV